MTGLLQILSLENEKSPEFPTIMQKHPTKATEIIQTIVKHLEKMISAGSGSGQWLDNIEILTLNSLLQRLCFDYHPSQSDSRNFKLNAIDFGNAHDGLLQALLRRIDNILLETVSENQ